MTAPLDVEAIRARMASGYEEAGAEWGPVARALGVDLAALVREVDRRRAEREALVAERDAVLEAKTMQEAAAGLLFGALALRAGGTITVFGSELRRAGAYTLKRESLGDAGVRFRVVSPEN